MRDAEPLLVGVTDTVTVRLAEVEGERLEEALIDAVLLPVPVTLLVAVAVAVPLRDALAVVDGEADTERVALALALPLGEPELLRVLDGVCEPIPLIDGVCDALGEADRLLVLVGEALRLPEALLLGVAVDDRLAVTLPVPVGD